MLFLQYIYANALVFNNDLHKKNISFIFDKNGLNLSPAYDVINIYVIRKLQKTQCVLHINGKLNRIQIEDFKQSSEILELDFYKVRDLLTQTLGIARSPRRIFLPSSNISRMRRRCYDLCRYRRYLWTESRRQYPSRDPCGDRVWK